MGRKMDDDSRDKGFCESFWKDYLPDFSPLISGSSGYKAVIFARSVHSFITRGSIFLGLVLYLNAQGSSMSSLGLLTTVYFAPQLLFNALVGRLSDALADRRFFVSLAFVGSGLLFFLYPAAGWVGFALAVRSLQGVLESAIRPLTQAVASGEAGPDRRAGHVGIFKVVVFGGSSLGPVLVGSLIQFWGFDPVFYLSGVVMIFAGLLLWGALPRRPSFEARGSSSTGLSFSWPEWRRHLLHSSVFSPDRGEGIPRPFSPSKWKKLSVSLFLLLTFFRRFSFGIINTFLPVYLVSTVGLAEGTVGLFEGVRRLMIVLAIVASGNLADSWGRKPLLVIASFSFLGPLVYALFPNMTGVWLGTIVLGITIGAFNPTCTTYVADGATPEERGTFLGQLAGVTAFSNVLGPVLGGFIADWTGISSAFLVGAVLIGVTVPLSALLRESRPGG